MVTGKPEDDMAARLRYWREKAGLTREQLAVALDFDPSTIRHWERGTAKPRDLEAFVKACGIDMRRFWSPLRHSPKTAVNG